MGVRRAYHPDAFIASAASRSTVPGTSHRYVLSSVTGNPHLFENGLRKLDLSLDDLIRMLETEEASTGSRCSNIWKGLEVEERIGGHA